MKANVVTYLSILIFIFAYSSVGAQQVTLQDLSDMNAEKASNAKEKLPSSRKWVQELSSTHSADSAVLVFKMEFKKEDKARHWVSVYSEEDKPKSVSYQTTKKMYVDKIVADLKAAGYTLTHSKITDSSRALYYSKDSIIVEVLTLSAETNPDPVYLVTLNS